MNLLKNALLYRPMKINLYLTIILNIMVGIFLFLILKLNNTNTFLIIIFLMIYILGLGLFLWFNYRDDTQIKLSGIKDQFKNNSSEIFSKKRISNFFYCLIYYIVNIIIIDIFFSKTINYFNPKLIQILSYIKVPFLILALLLLLFRIIYVITGISPFVVIFTTSLVLFITSFIGINNAILGWTFFMLIFGTLYNQFTNIDVKYLLSKEERGGIIQNEDEIKEKLNRDKYSVLLYLPFLYLSLLISENITMDKTFLYMVNVYTSSHFESLPKSYFTPYLFCAAILKIVILVMIYALYELHKDILLEYLAKKKLGVSRPNDSLSIDKGRYIKIKLSGNFFKKNWEIDENDYINVKDLVIIQYDFNMEDNGEKPSLTTKYWSLLEKDNPIYRISKDVLKIKSDFFVLENSEKIQAIKDKDKYSGKYLLTKVDYSYILLLSALIVIISGFYIFVDNDMIKGCRGVYYNQNIENKKIKSDIIYFVDDKIINVKQNVQYFNSSKSLKKTYTKVNRYKYDNVGLIIKDANGNKVGEIDRSSKTLLLKDIDGWPKEYIFDHNN
ncbi:hypothetical protein [Streptococcus australis]|uniref:hypothetical protein n=1 Tax=Streptococcus australis TaxID=113107 RepID=UPI0032F01827